ncbi:hypothetical protein HanIR_Chr04g0201611 [Helianthus annuus]|nr:hypothetical protein HanIR_Chr04g0201611 [Helianthus annuus]
MPAGAGGCVFPREPRVPLPSLSSRVQPVRQHGLTPRFLKLCSPAQMDVRLPMYQLSCHSIE